MYFELLEKAAHCRREALRCLGLGKTGFARRWLENGRGFIQAASKARRVFAERGEVGLPA